MRKSMIIFVLLLASGIGCICYAHSTLSAAQGNVSFTSVEEYGDVTAADGLTVSVMAHLENHLLWDTVFTFGQTPRTRTDFSFHTSPLRWTPEIAYPPLLMSLPGDINRNSSGINLLDENEAAGIYYPSPIVSYDILRDVAARTQNGGRHSETFYLRDYYEYYPITAQIFTGLQFGGYSGENYYYTIQGDVPSLGQIPDEAEVNKAFSDFFRIPVPEGHKVTVTIGKDSAGNVVQIETRQENGPYMYAASVETDDGIYFVISNAQGAADFSSVPGGFGVYLLPKATILDGQGTEYPTLDYKNLKTVFPLGISTADYDLTAAGQLAPSVTGDRQQLALARTATQLTLSEDGRCLNLITFEDGVYYLTVIELGSMAEKQKMPLFEEVGDGLFFMASYVDGFLYAELHDSRFVLAEKTAGNTYRQVLSGARDFLLSFEGQYVWTQPQIAWDGERLALVTRHRRSSPINSYAFRGLTIETCGFTLEIYDESGIRYKGAYESSLDVLTTSNLTYDICRLIDTGGLSAWW